MQDTLGPRRISSPLAVLLMILTATSPLLAPASAITTAVTDTDLRLDAWVDEKAAGVGDTVHINAQSLGESQAAVTSATILRYDVDALDALLGRTFPDMTPTEIDIVSLQRDGTWGDARNWSGEWTVPVNANGGVYVASVTLIDGGHSVTDDMTQISDEIIDRFEEVLALLDTALTTELFPAIEDIQDLFTGLQDNVTARGGWADFVTAANDTTGLVGNGSRDDTTGIVGNGSREYWADMIAAGHADENLSGAADFLEAFLIFVESDDMGAFHDLVMALTDYILGMPVPTEVSDLEELAAYLETIDPVENITRFEGTGDIDAAWAALTASTAWSDLMDAIEDVEPNDRVFWALQTIVTSIGDLAGSVELENLIAAGEAFVEGAEGDDLTPLLRFIRSLEGGFSDICLGVVDKWGDCLGDTKVAYRYLMDDTNEGQAWSSWITLNENHVHDTINDVETLPVGIIGAVDGAVESQAVQDVGMEGEAFRDWMDSVEGGTEHWVYFEDGVMDEEDDDPTFVSSRFHLDPMSFCVDVEQWGGANDMSVTVDLLDASDDSTVDSVTIPSDHRNDCYDDLEEYEQTSARGDVDTILEGDEVGGIEYIIDITVPADFSGDVGVMNHVDVGLSELMLLEQIDEAFIVSSMGVLVDAPLTARTSDTVSVDVLTYGGAGALSGVSADVAIVRISPQFAAMGDLEIGFTDSTIGDGVTPDEVSWMVENGPVEVVKEQVVTTASDGTATVSYQPTLPGFYGVFVQGELMMPISARGIGLSTTVVTDASMSLTGLTSMGTFSGIPVLRNTGDLGDAVALTATMTGLNASMAHTIKFGTGALDLKEVFPNAEGIDWGAEDDEDVELAAGDSSGVGSLHFSAPLQVLFVGVFDEDVEDFPVAGHLAIVMSGPDEVTLTVDGSVGPGQSATYTASHSAGTVQRYLGLAAPAVGVDTSSVDISSLSGFAYSMLRAHGPTFEAQMLDEEPDPICHGVSAEMYGTDTDAVKVELWVERIDGDSAGTVVVKDEDGTVVMADDVWSDGQNGSTYSAVFMLMPGDYTVETGTGDVMVTVSELDVLDYDGDTCPDDFIEGMMDQFLSDLGSVAWGLGDSADLHLPVLAAPNLDYMMLGLAQVSLDGGGVVVAIGTSAQVSIPNPAPPELRDLMVSWSPIAPVVGGTIVITVLDAGTPATGLSVLVYEDELLLISLVTDSNGQVEFTMPSGTLTTRISGGGFNPYSFQVVNGVPQVDPGTGGDDSGSSGGFVPAPGAVFAAIGLTMAALLGAAGRRRRD